MAIKGYKVFNPDFTCRGFQYEVGQTYKMQGLPIPCKKGFHFCENPIDCFGYYEFTPKNRVAEVVAVGYVRFEDDKVVTNEIQIVRELTWEEVLALTNTGVDNTGYGNTGHKNTGNNNSGFRNSGNRNTGIRNAGGYNSGDGNTGNCNSGNRNSGMSNSGHNNFGEYNSGNSNIGDSNTGDYNIGRFNSGDFNFSSHNSGCFNTESHTIMFFDKPSDWTAWEWYNSEARGILDGLVPRPTEWIYWGDMTPAEQERHPEYENTNGYLKRIDKLDNQTRWDNLRPAYKKIVLDLPNFDPEKFLKITGIDVTKEDK